MMRALVIAAALATLAAAAPRKVDSAQVSSLPSREADKAELQCNACRSAAVAVYAALSKVRKEFGAQPERLREYHLLAAVTDVCEKEENKLHVGLLQDVETKAVGTVFGFENEARRRDKRPVVKGGWVTAMWSRMCHELVDDVEDSLRSIFDAPIPAAQLCRRRCKNPAVEPIPDEL